METRASDNVITKNYPIRINITAISWLDMICPEKGFNFKKFKSRIHCQAYGGSKKDHFMCKISKSLILKVSRFLISGVVVESEILLVLTIPNFFSLRLSSLSIRRRRFSSCSARIKASFFFCSASFLRLKFYYCHV